MDKPKVNEKFLDNPIVSANLFDYLKTQYFSKNSEIKINEIQYIKKIKPFLQNNYGEKFDCTLSSILTLTYYYSNGKYSDKEIYDFIEKIAKKYLYSGNIWGTYPIFNKSIVKEVFDHFGIKRKVNTKYIKNIGFRLPDIIKLLDNNYPVLMSIHKDGRNYYDNHSVTIIGYNICQDNITGKTKTMLRIYDNWHSTTAFLDYDLLNADCMICY